MPDTNTGHGPGPTMALMAAQTAGSSDSVGAAMSEAGIPPLSANDQPQGAGTDLPQGQTQNTGQPQETGQPQDPGQPQDAGQAAVSQPAVSTVTAPVGDHVDAAHNASTDGQDIPQAMTNTTAHTNANTTATTMQHPSFFGSEGDLLHTSLVTAGYLCLLLGVILLGYFLLRRFGPSHVRKGTGHLSPTLKGRLMVGNKQSVAVVKVLGRVLVLGVTEHQITLLDKRSVQECLDMDEEEQEHAFTKFAEMLGKSDGKKDGG